MKIPKAMYPALQCFYFFAAGQKGHPILYFLGAVPGLVPAVVGGNENEPILFLVALACAHALHQLIGAAVAVGNAFGVEIVVVAEGDPVAAAVRPFIDAENAVCVRIDCVEQLLVKIVFILTVQVLEREPLPFCGFYLPFLGVCEVCGPQAVEAGGDSPACKLQQHGRIFLF